LKPRTQPDSRRGKKGIFLGGILFFGKRGGGGSRKGVGLGGSQHRGEKPVETSEFSKRGWNQRKRKKGNPGGKRGPACNNQKKKKGSFPRHARNCEEKNGFLGTKRGLFFKVFWGKINEKRKKNLLQLTGGGNPEETSNTLFLPSSKKTSPKKTPKGGEEGKKRSSLPRRRTPSKGEKYSHTGGDNPAVEIGNLAKGERTPNHN